MERLLRSARESGSLNLSNRNLRKVPIEVYKGLDAAGEGEKWWEAVELQKLILAHNNIEVLEDDLRNLSLLSVLNVSHNELTSLPGAIGGLSMLKLLDVSFNAIAVIPEEIGLATSLVKFDCSNNLLEELPESLGGCHSLSELKVSNNNIANLPHGLVHCSKLMKIDVEGNKLTELPEDLIMSCSMLTELNAAKNKLGSIPSNVGNLTRLIRIDFHQNRISSLPSSIGTCNSLTELYLGTNIVSFIPEEIGRLSRLGTLDLHSNQLKEFPVEACKLRLSALDLSNNSLSGLPPELGNMVTLRRLLLNGNPMRTLRSTLVSGPTSTLLKYLRNRLSSNEDSGAIPGHNLTPSKENQIAAATRMSLSSKELLLSGLNLETVPPAVWENKDIVKLDLSKNSIGELPQELSTCLMLQNLTLSGNKFKEWPGSVLSNFTNLSCLKMDANVLKQIPFDGFRGLSKLQILDLSGNPSSYPEPSGLSNLPQLQELYLRRMQLREVPSDLLHLPQLHILDLSQNIISSVPKEFKALGHLTELDLSDNNIATLPAELGLLESSLQVLKLDGNPLRSIRRSILDRGTKALLQYLKDRIPDN